MSLRGEHARELPIEEAEKRVEEAADYLGRVERFALFEQKTAEAAFQAHDRKKRKALDRRKARRESPYPADRIAALLRKNTGGLYGITKVFRDNQQRFHNDKGPSVEWSDGYAVYALEGIVFESQIWKGLVENTLTAQDAIGLRNLTQRRYAIRKIGYAAMVEDPALQKVSEDETYILWKGQFNDDSGRPAMILQMKCPSTGMIYFIRVPPPIQTASFVNSAGDLENVAERTPSIREYVAWTFGFERNNRWEGQEPEWEKYRPLKET